MTPRERPHHCHAKGCQIAVPPEMLMCKRHWFMVPASIRAEVWRHYRQGQCDLNPPPSQAWHDAANAAIAAVAKREVNP